MWETTDGRPSGASATAHPDYAGAVQDVAALRAIPETERVDKQQRLVEDKGTAYYFDTTGAGVDDGDLIIKPTDVGNGGRWFKIVEGGVPTPHAVSHKGSGSDEVAAATGSLAGLMPSADKAKLDVIDIVNTVQTTNADQTTIATIPIPDDTVVLIEVRVLGRRTNGVARAAYIRRFAVFREAAGVATLEGAVDTPFSRESEGAWGVVGDVDGGNNARVRVFGAIGHDINWKSFHTVKEVG